jgi:hypothetical protein
MISAARFTARSGPPRRRLSATGRVLVAEPGEDQSDDGDDDRHDAEVEYSDVRVDRLYVIDQRLDALADDFVFV